MRFQFLSITLCWLNAVGYAETLNVGAGYPYPTLNEALAVIEPGDLVLVHEGTYAGGLYFEDIQGTADNWIFIQAAPGETVIFDGGSNAWQFTDAAYLHISGFIFEHQVGNGLNFDDGGTYESPAHHIIFEACIFRDMQASGNNDLLKLSGLDDFEIRDCLFLNGADEGSGIDMVGCHEGIITSCYFEDMGSNAIQAKGGTRNIRIEANFFKNAGQRSLNLGGSTGLQFFRPLDAEYEAAELKVNSNIFIGSTAPIAFVGCINSQVINNTIYLPDNWVLRILQETVDTSRFFPCGNNAFINNLIYIDNSVNVVCNIGPNTAPETFTFSHNLWYHSQNPGWPGPVLPGTDGNQIVGEDPLFSDGDAEDYSLLPGSPAIGNGLTVDQPEFDYTGFPFNDPRSIGAFEGNMMTLTEGVFMKDLFLVYPNPASKSVTLHFSAQHKKAIIVSLFTPVGAELFSLEIPGDTDVISIPVSMLASGVYLLCLTDDVVGNCKAVMIHH